MKMKYVVCVVLFLSVAAACYAGEFLSVGWDGTTLLADGGGTNPPVALPSSALPSGTICVTNPSVGTLLRYDGTNWLATSGYICTDGTNAWDWALTNLTTDASWNTLSVATNRLGQSRVPEGTKAVVLVIRVKDNAASSTLQLRGVGDNAADARCPTIVSGVGSYYSVIVGVSAARTIEYNADNVTWQAVGIRIVGAFY